MKFSIITASYNQGRFIRDCIESVKGQTDVEWEHLVQDSESTDETHTILNEYTHLNCRIEKDQGMSDGINRGFKRATGDWLMWLNTDDYLLPGALQRVSDFAQKHPKADIIYGDVDFVSGSKELIRHKREHRFDFNVLLFYGCYIQSTATFYRREIIQEDHLLDTDFRVCMDFEYYVRLARLGFQFKHLPAALAAFRWHEANTSAVQLKLRRAERLQVQQRYLATVGRKGWLSQPTTLKILYRLFQARRQWLRATTFRALR